MRNFDKLMRIFPMHIANLFKKSGIQYNKLQEIRIRIHCPICIRYRNDKFTMSQSQGIHKRFNEGYIIEESDINEIIEYMSRYSLYAYEEEIKQGFMTIEGGHRIGIVGQAVLEKGQVKTIRNITFLNIRVAHEIKGCADKIIPYLRHGDGIYHSLIISPPGKGKTTLLRDVIRQLSNGEHHHQGLNIGLVDERSEIAACHLGIPQNDLGIQTDVLDNCPKAEGMLMLIRSMAPDVLAVDEIGGEGDVKAIEYAINCGCHFIGTIHGKDFEEIKRKPQIKDLVYNKIFDRYIVIGGNKNAGEIESIYDGDGNEIV